MANEHEYRYETYYSGRYDGRCPNCGGDDVMADGEVEYLSGGELEMPMRCDACGCTWDDVYGYHAFTHFKVPGREAL